MQVESLKKLKDSLPYGWQKNAVIDLNISKVTISAMINGKQKMSPIVAEYLINLARDYQKTLHDLENQIQQIWP